jgi:hypothetical protein
MSSSDDSPSFSSPSALLACPRGRTLPPTCDKPHLLLRVMQRYSFEKCLSPVPGT